MVDVLIGIKAELTLMNKTLEWIKGTLFFIAAVAAAAAYFG